MNCFDDEEGGGWEQHVEDVHHDQSINTVTD